MRIWLSDLWDRAAQRLWRIFFMKGIPVPPDGWLEHERAVRAAKRSEDEREVVPKDWLVDRIDLGNAEALFAPGFGIPNRNWEDFKASLRPGDELWTFSTPPESWRQMAGREGLAVVRDGRAVVRLVTMMN